MSHSTDPKPAWAHSDAWTGLALMVTGGIAAWLARGFDQMSRSYPLVLGWVLVGLGALLLLNALRHKTPSVSFRIPGQVALLAALILGLWTMALSGGLGYLLPTFVMQLCFILLCGSCGLAQAAIIAATITGVSYLAFIVGLGVRLPATLLPWLV
ncbi:tripartite tricarboxylate transporter TctB family protein [Roseovarius sp. C7]|uniref:tripartite tricarboxylate transporter TctB family protein n=1 Tax=Roseovarius sp. C7 TaxID=3398643 RepID=UPI0039F6ABF4